MLGAGNHVDAGVFRQGDVPDAQRIGVQQRCSLLPVLGRGIGLDQQRIGPVTAEKSTGLAGQRVGEFGRRERKLVLGIVMVLVLSAGASRLGEGRVEEHAADAGNMRMNAVEDLAALLVAVEALGDVVAEIAAGLGEADGKRMCDRPAGHLASLRVVLQPAHEVSGRGEAQSLHLRVGAPVGEFVDVSGLRLAFDKLDRPGVNRRPRDFLRRICLTPTYGELRAVLRGHSVRKPESLEGSAARARDEFVPYPLDDGLAILSSHRRGQAQSLVGAGRVGVPAGPDDYVAPSQREAVAEVGQGLGIVHALRAVGDVAEQHLAAAVVHFVEDAAVAPCGVVRAQHEEVRRVLDHAARIAWRFIDQRDALVGGVRRIDLALRGADDALIGAGRTEGSAIGQWLDGLDVDRAEHAATWCRAAGN